MVFTKLQENYKGTFLTYEIVCLAGVKFICGQLHNYSRVETAKILAFFPLKLLV